MAVISKHTTEKVLKYSAGSALTIAHNQAVNRPKDFSDSIVFLVE